MQNEPSASPARIRSAVVAANAVAVRMALWLVSALSAAGCALQAGGIPAWAMHIRPAVYDAKSSPDIVARWVEQELNRPGRALPDGHVGPELIASMAIPDIEAGRQVDAALWLALASYRYHEETVQAYLQGEANGKALPSNVRVSAYWKLVNAEIESHARLSFADELGVVGNRIYGRNETEKALQEQMAALGKTSPMERTALRDALWQLQPAAHTPVSPRYPSLAEAFRRRMHRDFAADSHDEHPGMYLARTPLPALQADAVFAVIRTFCLEARSSSATLRPAAANGTPGTTNRRSRPPPRLPE